MIHPSSGAYYTIPYEIEAYANQDNFNYLSTRKHTDINKYRIKDRKKTYEKYGRIEFLNYIKTL